MKSAEDHLKEKFPTADKCDWFRPMVEIINAARVEAMEEDRINVAKCANVIYSYSEFDDKVIEETIKVDKGSILNAPYPD